MNRVLEFRPPARAEFDEAADWYEEQRAGLRAEFVFAVDAIFARLSDEPYAFPIVHGENIRKALVSRFPYAVFFEVDGSKIVVHAVFHMSRDPFIWRGRID